MAHVLVARRLGHTVLDLLFPPRCVGCGEGGTFLCAGCAASLTPADGPRCQRCWRPDTYAGVCITCRGELPAFDGLRAAFVYGGLARELVRGLKYGGSAVLAEPMAVLMAEVVRAQDLFADVIVPVPLSGLRKRTRGYNQAEVLTRSLGRELGLPVRPQALARTRHTAPQARTADAATRRRNVAGAFRAREAEAAGRRLLLIDDVTTTGATLAAAAGALKAAGAREVWALAFARED